MMPVTIERFDVTEVPITTRRPRVVELTSGAGNVSVHVSRDDGSLWLFADGPRGGRRGEVVFPLTQAEQMKAWLDGDTQGAAPSRAGVLWLDPDGDHHRTLVVADRVSLSLHSRELKMQLDAEALAELIAAFREWSSIALEMAARA